MEWDELTEGSKIVNSPSILHVILLVTIGYMLKWKMTERKARKMIILKTIC